MKTGYTLIALGGLMVAGCGGSGGGQSAPNAAPTVSAITDQTITANQAGQPIDFTVADDATAAENLTVTAMAISVDLVRDSDIQVVGQNSTRSLVITPVADEAGESMVSVIVTDEAGLGAASSFLLTVEPQQKGLSEFVRTAFAESADGDPNPINAVVFEQDADDDEFEDLLTQ